jgi:hypothetical protein
MTAVAQLILSVSAILQPASEPPCIGAPSAPALDHVVLVVRDLDAASAGFEQQGFVLKRGRLHPNSLLNRHIKFRDGSGIELMTVQGQPGDAMAQDYVDLLEVGEGGVYVALAVADVDAPGHAAAALRLDRRQSASGSWQFLSFPPGSPAAALFFSAGVPVPNDLESTVSHDPDVSGLAEAWVEGDSAMGELLRRVGATDCGDARALDGRVGRRWGLSRGALVIVSRRPQVRPRLLGVVLQGRTPGERTVFPHREFWVRYRVESP